MSITIPALSRQYPGNDQFTLETSELTLTGGGYVCVIGKNGCGKSSFGEALANQDKLQSGHNWYFLPQYMERFLFAENLVEQLTNLLAQELDLNRLKELLQDLGFSDPTGMLDFPFILMSGGERRRIALVCAFYLDPDYLILDEPDIGVTAKENMVLLAKIHNLQAKNAQVILISHSYEFVKGSSDLICLDMGRVQRVGRTRDILADSQFEIKDYGVRFQQTYA